MFLKHESLELEELEVKFEECLISSGKRVAILFNEKVFCPYRNDESSPQCKIHLKFD